MKRICPSLICVARSNTPRHFCGLMKGSNPSITSISATAPSSISARLGAEAKPYFFFAGGAGGADVAGADGPPPRSAWKNSPLESTIIRSDLLRRLER